MPWVRDYFEFGWREALTTDYLFRWRVLCKARVELEGVSQRVQEDAQNFAPGVVFISGEIVTLIVAIVEWAPLLWTQTADLETLKGWPAGAMVWMAIGTGIFGAVSSALLARPLISLNYRLQAREAAFRKELVYAEDAVVGVGGLAACRELFSEVRRVTFSIFNLTALVRFWNGVLAQGE